MSTFESTRVSRPGGGDGIAFSQTSSIFNFPTFSLLGSLNVVTQSQSTLCEVTRRQHHHERSILRRYRGSGDTGA
ncbi:MAG: hypothetical protein JKY23_00500 [Nitrospinaceae bacterium]|nr:hypothetical protein [Nitrospinaceae bacterium]